MADNNRVIVELGTVIKNRGEWDSLAQNAKLYKDNVVQYNGSAYIVKSAPASGIGKDILPTNTAYYEVFAGVGEVATGSDFDAPSATQRGKITTVGAVLDGMNDGVYNLTAKTGDSYATLNDALIAANNTIPTNKKRGGMSICFVNSTDHKYVQYRLMADEFTTDTTQWAIADEGVYVENPEFVRVYTDKNDKILWGIKADGTVYFGAGVPPQVVEYTQQKIEELKLNKVEDIVTFLGNLIEGVETLQELLDKKLDAEGLDSDALSTMEAIENPEWIDVKTDSEDKILEANMPDGTKYLPTGVKIFGKIEIEGAEYTLIQNQEWFRVLVDAQKRIIAGVRLDGSVFINNIEGFTERVQEVVNALFINKTTLDKFSENNGTLLWNDSPIEGGTISTLVVDLPVSDGTGIESGYAYIDNTDRTIKVKA